MQGKKKSGAAKFFTSKVFIIICAVVVLAAVAAVAVTTALNSNPLTQISKAAKNSARSLARGGSYAVIEDAADNGSVEISWNLEKFMEQMDGISADLGLNLKIFMDSKNNATAEEISLSVEGDKLAGATLYSDADKIVIESPELLGDAAYGVALEKLAKNFEKSIFADEDSMYWLGLDTEVFESIENYQANLENAEGLAQDISEIYEEFFAVIMKSADKNALISKKAGSIDFAGQTVKTNDVVIALDSEAVVAIIEDVLKYLDGNKKIEALLENYVDFLGAGYADIDVDDLIDEYQDGIDTALDEIGDLEDEIEDIEIEIVISISKSKKEIVGVSVYAEFDGDEVEFEAVCGPTWKNISEFRITADNGYETFELVYEVSENSADAFEAAFEVTVDDETIAEAECVWDKKDGDFELTLSDAYSEIFAAEGTLERGDKRTVLTLGTIAVDGEEFDLGELVITINANDKVPAAGKYTDILTLDEDEMDDILDDIEELVADLAEEFQSALQ